MGSHIKGYKFERAKPSNILDVWALYEEYLEAKLKETDSYPKIPKSDFVSVYEMLTNALKIPDEIVILARKGRGYHGFLHGKIVERPFGRPKVSIFVYGIWVTEKRRKLGLSRGLIDELEDLASKLGIGAIELMCNDELEERWGKHGAKKVLNYMVKEL